MARIHVNNVDTLKSFALVLTRKVALVALGWVVIYFLFQFMRKVPDDGGVNITTLFALLAGGAAGVVAGWYLAVDAVEDSGMQGLPLWCILVAGAVAPMWMVEGLLKAITGWPMNVGGYMMVAAASVMALASAVWTASAQE